MSLFLRACSVHTPIDFSDFCCYINNLYAGHVSDVDGKYIFDDNVLRAMNELNQIINTSPDEKSTIATKLPTESYSDTESNPENEIIDISNINFTDIDSIQKNCIALIEQATSDPLKSDHIIDLIVRILTIMTQMVFKVDESALNIDELRTYIKSYIHIAKINKVCSKYKRFDAENLDPDTKDMCLFFKAFTCTECGLSEDNHLICNKYDDDDNNYYCTNCGMNNDKHNICESFKYDDHVRTIKCSEKKTDSIYEIHIFKEYERKCIDCGKTRGEHINKLRANKIYPCELYCDDTHGYCSKCTYGISEHMSSNLINELTDNNYKKAKLDIATVNIYTASSKSEINLAIFQAVANITNNKNFDSIAEYFNIYFKG
jgi:hypothetical protein